MATALGARPVIGVITNPNSKKNRRIHDRVEQLQAIVGPYGVVRQTPTTEQIKPVIREFLDLGVDFWVSDGGDGALYWMLNSAHDVIEQRFPDTDHFERHLRFALPTNGGTIDYVARRAGVRGRAEDILKKLVEVYEKGEQLAQTLVPSLRLEGVQELRNGTRRRFEKVGFATAIAGVGNRFFEKYYLARVPGPKVICEVIAKTSASYLVGVTPASRVVPEEWLEYGEQVLRPMPARVEVDGEVLSYSDYTTIAVGAFKINLGGVIRLFPFASRGAMHVTAGEPSPLDMIVNLPRMLSGRRLACDRMFDGPGREVRVVATSSTLLRPNVDGEFIENVRELVVRPGPRFRIPRIDAKS